MNEDSTQILLNPQAKEPFKILKSGSITKQKQLLELIQKFNIVILEDEPEAERIADIYVKEGIVPAKYSTDGLHIALATAHDMDIIVSWNFKHIVKRKTILMANVVNNREGYKSLLKSPFFSLVKYLNIGCALSPFTAIFSNIVKVTP